MKVVVACTGRSMSVELLERVRALPVVAVNGVFRLAPWATALAANDRAWWLSHLDAFEFPGQKFSTNVIDKVERILGGAASNSCSGVLGLEVAKRLGATSIVMIGADFSGDHFFGRYDGRLRNTTPDRRRVHERQFRSWAKSNKAIPIINATPGSALAVFPVMTLDEALAA